MVEQGIVLGHVVSKNGISVDPAKVDIISQLPYPSSMKEVRSFLGHVGFYKRFIKDFSKIANPLSNLLQKDVAFDFGERCKDAFDTLKKALTTTPIIQPPNWTSPFELMCDASNFAVGAVLAQRNGKLPHVIYYASRSLDTTQANYTTTKRELLVVVFALDKFRPYIASSSFGFSYILLVVDYVSKWVEAIATRTNDSRVVMSFVRSNIFCRFGIPRAIISDQGTHFCNKVLENMLKKYGVTHRIATPYHP